MDQILGVIGSVPSLQKVKDDSLTDRLSHKFTVGLLILFSVIVSAKQYVGDPINCWVPAHFSDAWAAYATSYCWIKNTYYLPFHEYIPRESDGRNMITYYQWVPLILLTQALVFYIPCMVWRTFNARSGIDINNVVDTCRTFQLLEKVENKNKTLDHLTKQVYRFVDSHHGDKGAVTLSIKSCLSRICCSMCGRRHGNYLVILYLLVKVLYIGNIIAQFFLMNEFLGTKYHEYGVRFFEMLATGEETMDIPAFPRVTMCDFKIRVLGNVQRYTVQCVLPINLFNEMIYLFLWCWMVFLGFASIFSLLSWIVKIAMSSDRERFIKKHLMLLNRLIPSQDAIYDSDCLTVEVTERSELLDRRPQTQPSYADSKPSSDITGRSGDDKYATLKELMTEKCNQQQVLDFKVKVNPKKDRDLLGEILEIAPEDGRRSFSISGGDLDIFDKFIETLHQDGIFVLRIVGNNTNSITITEVVCALWDKHCERYFKSYLDNV